MIGEWHLGETLDAVRMCVCVCETVYERRNDQCLNGLEDEGHRNKKGNHAMELEARSE